MKIKLKSITLNLIIAGYFCFVLNINVILRLINDISNLDNFSIAFVISLPIFGIALFYLLFLPFSAKFMQKPFAIILIIISSFISYSSYQYGIIFDEDMIANFMQTDYAEASSYLNISSILWFVGFGLLPALFVYFTEVTYQTWYKELIHKIISVVIVFIIIGIIAALFYKDYSSVARNDSRIRKIIIPTYYIGSSYKYIKHKYFKKTYKYKEIATDAKIDNTPLNKKKLIILIVGETARSANYQLNGYGKETNSYTKDIKNLTYFKNTTSCGTATNVSVPCMFSILPRSNYSRDVTDNQDNLLDIIKRTNTDITWLENNSSCKGVCKHINTIDMRKKYGNKKEYCYQGDCSSGAVLDSVFLEELHNQLANADSSKNKLIVLHIMGSHGPTYFKRYPKDFTHFKPSCNQSDIQNCSNEKIINTYDNTILYTDYIMSKIINILQSETDKWDSGLIYMSDHGESLGENGLYLHGFPYSIAPPEQKNIPMISWFSDSMKESLKLSDNCLQQKANKGGYSQDNLFYTMLGLFNISTEVYKPKMDIFRDCRQ